ncbi:DUF3465 domain-containing protein [Desulforhopalus sp. IMCC35007]|uniref:DUF3465 domain-containing protein n=1 Tax=Desulforhopalus sp. IMCC35007 TaxID=2569543 RepID=UPI0010ADE2F7|nr:DUF3465 domain-containing protein [Desulforhopalus sp. IMCC35007]TKB05742.1 DUF3465 domain-containing protein [Desulforhopalus sp. IMCC35007]
MKIHSKLTRTVLLCLVALVVVVADYYKNNDSELQPGRDESSQIEQAFLNKQQSVQVTGSGTVVKLLPDDLDGSRHQKFIVKISENFTILIAHNIDLAPKITDLHQGDQIGFSGEYEFNNRGGVVHWTHHDPARQHPDGWLEHNGTMYK